MADLDQRAILRPFVAAPDTISEDATFPPGHASWPLGHAWLHECIADGLIDVDPGSLVQDGRGRLCIVIVYMTDEPV